MRLDVDSTIQDNKKKAKLMSIINQFEEALGSLDKAVSAHSLRLMVVDQNIHSTPDDFRQVYELIYCFFAGYDENQATS